MPDETGKPRRSLVREMQHVEKRLREVREKEEQLAREVDEEEWMEEERREKEKNEREEEREKREKDNSVQRIVKEEEKREKGKGHTVQRVASLPVSDIPHLEGGVIVVSNSAHCCHGSELLSDDEYMDAVTCDHHVTLMLSHVTIM